MSSSREDIPHVQAAAKDTGLIETPPVSLGKYRWKTLKELPRFEAQIDVNNASPDTLRAVYADNKNDATRHGNSLRYFGSTDDGSSITSGDSLQPRQQQACSTDITSAKNMLLHGVTQAKDGNEETGASDEIDDEANATVSLTFDRKQVLHIDNAAESMTTCDMDMWKYMSVVTVERVESKTETDTETETETEMHYPALTSLYGIITYNHKEGEVRTLEILLHAWQDTKEDTWLVVKYFDAQKCMEVSSVTISLQSSADDPCQWRTDVRDARVTRVVLASQAPVTLLHKASRLRASPRLSFHCVGSVRDVDNPQNNPIITNSMDDGFQIQNTIYPASVLQYATETVTGITEDEFWYDVSTDHDESPLKYHLRQFVEHDNNKEGTRRMLQVLALGAARTSDLYDLRALSDACDNIVRQDVDRGRAPCGMLDDEESAARNFAFLKGSGIGEMERETGNAAGYNLLAEMIGEVGDAGGHDLQRCFVPLRPDFHRHNALWPTPLAGAVVFKRDTCLDPGASLYSSASGQDWRKGGNEVDDDLRHALSHKINRNRSWVCDRCVRARAHSCYMHGVRPGRDKRRLKDFLSKCGIRYSKMLFKTDFLKDAILHDTFELDTHREMKPNARLAFLGPSVRAGGSASRAFKRNISTPCYVHTEAPMCVDVYVSKNELSEADLCPTIAQTLANDLSTDVVVERTCESQLAQHMYGGHSSRGHLLFGMRINGLGAPTQRTLDSIKDHIYKALCRDCPTLRTTDVKLGIASEAVGSQQMRSGTMLCNAPLCGVYMRPSFDAITTPDARVSAAIAGSGVGRQGVSTPVVLRGLHWMGERRGDSDPPTYPGQSGSALHAPGEAAATVGVADNDALAPETEGALYSLQSSASHQRFARVCSPRIDPGSTIAQYIEQSSPRWCGGRERRVSMPDLRFCAFLKWRERDAGAHPLYLNPCDLLDAYLAHFHMRFRDISSGDRADILRTMQSVLRKSSAYFDRIVRGRVTRRNRCVGAARCAGARPTRAATRSRPVVALLSTVTGTGAGAGAGAEERAQDEHDKRVERREAALVFAMLQQKQHDRVYEYMRSGRFQKSIRRTCAGGACCYCALVYRLTKRAPRRANIGGDSWTDEFREQRTTVEDGAVLCNTCGMRICADRLDESEALIASSRANNDPITRLYVLIIHRQRVVDDNPFFWAYVHDGPDAEAADAPSATKKYEKRLRELCDTFQSAFEHIWHQNNVCIPVHVLMKEIVHSNVCLSELGVTDTTRTMTLTSLSLAYAKDEEESVVANWQRCMRRYGGIAAHTMYNAYTSDASVQDPTRNHIQNFVRALASRAEREGKGVAHLYPSRNNPDVEQQPTWDRSICAASVTHAVHNSAPPPAVSSGATVACAQTSLLHNTLHGFKATPSEGAISAEEVYCDLDPRLSEYKFWIHRAYKGKLSGLLRADERGSSADERDHGPDRQLPCLFAPSFPDECAEARRKNTTNILDKLEPRKKQTITSALQNKKNIVQRIRLILRRLKSNDACKALASLRESNFMEPDNDEKTIDVPLHYRISHEKHFRISEHFKPTPPEEPMTTCCPICKAPIGCIAWSRHGGANEEDDLPQIGQLLMNCNNDLDENNTRAVNFLKALHAVQTFSDRRRGNICANYFDLCVSAIQYETQIEETQKKNHNHNDTRTRELLDMIDCAAPSDNALLINLVLKAVGKASLVNMCQKINNPENTFFDDDMLCQTAVDY